MPWRNFRFGDKIRARRFGAAFGWGSPGKIHIFTARIGSRAMRFCQVKTIGVVVVGIAILLTALPASAKKTGAMSFTKITPSTISSAKPASGAISLFPSSTSGNSPNVSLGTGNIVTLLSRPAPAEAFYTSPFVSKPWHPAQSAIQIATRTTSSLVWGGGELGRLYVWHARPHQQHPGQHQ